MSQSRKNHYVPQWYQEGFFEPGVNSLRYLDLDPPKRTLPGGRVITHNFRFVSPTSRCFWQQDLYSTFFGTSVNDEIERLLFGAIDTRGSKAVRAFIDKDETEWHNNFQSLFEFIDIQKIRTPKGLDWLRAQYPDLSQNELMMEMQRIRMLHCTIWTQGVREIVSAEAADVKFLISDHPVTIYNHALPPDHNQNTSPHDPSIALKASQTIFPLNRDFCLILTNLEYAKDPSAVPLQKRTFARNFSRSMVNTIDFIRSRTLSDVEVIQINHILKSRARRFIAAGKEDWLYPEQAIAGDWAGLRETLLPRHELYRFGGEMYAKSEDGHVHYQDQFGRTEKPYEHLIKEPSASIRLGDPCGCGSGETYKLCCKKKKPELRPSWTERSIRERNLFLFRAIEEILGIDEGKDWVTIRRELTDDQIKEVYRCYASLWPLETDLLSLLPKPDGTARAVYTGSIHPFAFSEYALGASLYFGELIVQTPFINARCIRKEYSPVDNPKAYRHEFLRTVLLFLHVMPLVEIGLINLIPDPCDFDAHLREQMMDMAKERAPSMNTSLDTDPRLKALMEEDYRRNIACMPTELLRNKLKSQSPELDDAGIDAAIAYNEMRKEQDPLADLTVGAFEGGKDGGQFSMMKLSPNFEISMYLAQATGAYIVTDSKFRWEELQRVIRFSYDSPPFALNALSTTIAASDFLFPVEPSAIFQRKLDCSMDGYPSLTRRAFRYLTNIAKRGEKPNFEAQMNAEFGRVHKQAQTTLSKAGTQANTGKMSAAFPVVGIQDNTINRLLLMSSSEHHLSSVPMAFLIQPSS